jgi:hypothetical protein
MDYDEYQRFERDANRLEEAWKYLQRFYAIAAEHGLSQKQSDDMLDRWRKYGRKLFTTDTERAEFFHRLVRGASDWQENTDGQT